MLALPRTIRHVRDIAEHDEFGIAFRRLLPRGQSPMRPPLFVLGDPIDLAPLYAQIATPELGCYEIRDAAIAPTGVALQEETAFCAQAFLHPPHHVIAIADRLNAAPLPTRHVPGPLAVIEGPGHETWGHWLTDFLPRLAVLAECGWDIAALRFVVPPDLAPFATELFRLCGIGSERLIVNRHWREVLTTDLLVMPTSLRVEDRLSPFFAEATRFWQRRWAIRMNIPAARFPARIFLSRAGATGTRVMLNRSEIEHEAKRRGLAVLRPETLSLPEQAALFRGARLIVGEYGSALHNSVFAGPGTLVCGLRGTARHPGFYQSGIATALDQQAGYVLGATPGQDVEQRFKIAPAAFHQAIDILDAAYTP